MRGRAVWLLAAAAASLLLFLGGLYLRLHLAYGPFNLSLRPGDWIVLWELFRTGQISTRVVLEGTAAGLALALVPWGLRWRVGGGGGG